MTSVCRSRTAQTRIAIAVALTIAILTVAALTIAPKRPAPSRRPSPIAAAPAPPPPPPPTLLSDLTPDQARASNLARPVAAGPVPPAPPFFYRGAPADLAAAETCLAAAILYEAGDDREGEQAVAQVVVNRVRHPSFPKTVCGVVFQGSARLTGCQFTFTCDGALAREAGSAAWDRARAIARAALSGAVDRSVGTATHYHADYVVPYWRDSLRKVAAVHSQIFYAFPGFWGRPAALSGHLAPPESLDERLLRLAPELAVDGDATLPAADANVPRQKLAVAGVPAAALKGSIVRLKDEDAAQFILQLDTANPAGWSVTGYTICAAHPDCLVLGWTAEAETPRTLPILPGAMRTLAFMYRKSSLLGEAQPFWACGRFRRPLRAQCLPR